MTAGILPACQQTIAAFVFVILTLFLPPALQCVYMLCDKGTVLGDVHDAVKCMLERKEGVSLFLANATYMPHMSLVYGDLNKEQKEEAKAMALEKLREETKRLGRKDEDCILRKFEMDSWDIYLTPMEGNCTKNWSCLAHCPL